MSMNTRDDSVLEKPARPAPARVTSNDPDRSVADSVGRLDIGRLRDDYTRQGAFLYLDTFLPPDAAGKLADTARALQADLNRNYLPGHKQGGSVSRHTIDAKAPYIAELYRSKALIGFPAAVDALLSHHIGAGASGNANDTPAGATHAMLRKSAVAVRRALHTYGSRSTGYRNTCARLAARLESVAWPASAIEDACRIALTLPSPETRDSTSRDQAPASLDETTRLALLADRKSVV